MNVLVCDDDQQIVDSIIEELKKKSEETHVALRFYGFSQPSQIDLSLPYDIALLDIDMGETNGIELARKLRAENGNIVIIFITNFIQYAPEGFEVQAFRYLLGVRGITDLQFGYHGVPYRIIELRLFILFLLAPLLRSGHGGTGRRHPEQTVSRRAIPLERPGKSGQGHDQQKQGGIYAQRNMAVVPEAPPSLRTRHEQAVLQCLAGTRNPYRDAGDEDDNHYEGSDAHDNLAG